jgi:glycosyltransferase involved in cell wall biosynthesis
MRILFDPQIFSLQAFGGISRYFVELAKSINKIQGESAEIFAPLHINLHLDEYFSTGGREHAKNGIFSPSSNNLKKHALLAGNYFRLKKYLRHANFEILHHTYYWPMPLKGFKGARITTIHDMVEEIFRQQGVKSYFKKKFAREADHVICVSENTKNDLIERFDIPASKISVVYLGRPVVPARSLSFRPPTSKPYILYVGQRGGYKNFSGLLRALALTERVRKDFDLVCFGGGNFTAEERTLMKQFNLDEPKLMTDGASDQLLYDTYRQATALVYPSLYEGFGLPPLEAMAMGVAVICSHCSSIPEVVGDAGEYFDPAEPESLRYALESVLYSEEKRRKLVQRGQVRAGFFSWDKCARDTLSVYKSLF